MEREISPVQLLTLQAEASSIDFTSVKGTCDGANGISLADFTRKFGRFRPEKGRILLRKHQEVTRKFGRPTRE